MLRMFAVFAVLLVGWLFIPATAGCDQGIMFQHLTSLYADDKGQALLQPEGVACDEKQLVVADTAHNRLVQYSIQTDGVKGGKQLQMPQLVAPIRVQLNAKGEIFALDGKNRRIVHLSQAGAFLGNIEVKGLPAGGALVPRSFKIDRNDTLYILDIFSGRVVVCNAQGEFQRQIPLPKEFGFFSDLAVDRGGDIYLIDSVNSMVYQASSGGQSFAPLTKNLKEYMLFPTCITTDNKGVLYVTDQNGGSIVLLGTDGAFRSRKLAMGWKEGLLHYPVAMCVNGNGQAFVADRNNNRIQMFR